MDGPREPGHFDTFEGPALGVTDEFDDLRDAEESAREWFSKVRQPATRRTDGRGS